VADLLKDFYSKEYIKSVADAFKKVYEGFGVEAFLASTLDNTWENLELKARSQRITDSLGKCLPKDYREAIKIIDRAIEAGGSWLDGFAIFLPGFVETFGLDEENLGISIEALGRYTCYASSEFAVRPFIIKYEEKMMAQMLMWASSENEHLRRLASEGCRPRLPWGQALAKYKKDPSPVLPILEVLKADESLYVRKSVANNLNDIAKDNPDVVIETVKRWHGKNPLTDWIVKHGCRTLLKQGNPEVLGLFGFNNADCVKVEGFSLERDAIKIGEDISFSFSVVVEESTKVRLEYGMDFVKANGKRNRKIFQISETPMEKGQKKEYTKKYSFVNLSTRKHYVGTHAITLIVNGVEQETVEFEVGEA